MFYQRESAKLSSMTTPESNAARPAHGTWPPRPPLRVILAAVALLLLHFTLAVAGKRAASTSTDELAHLTAGFSYWQNHDYRLHPENGNLPQRWAALPGWLTGAPFPNLNGNEYWRTSDVWIVGHQFFYESGADHFPRLMAGRAMTALFSVGTGVLVLLWSWRFFGPTGALVSLTFFVFSPDFLAHGALATSDGCMVFFFLAATAAWWRHLHDGRAVIWWLSALVLGLAFVAKYSAVLLVPMMIAMAAVRAWAPAPWQVGRWRLTTPLGKFGVAALSAVGHAAIVALVIWAFYGFRFAAGNPSLPPADHFIKPWSDFIGKTGLLGEATRALAQLHALPEAFLYGFDYVLFSTKSRSAFLNGEHSLTGWRTFFIWSFLLKTTLPLLITALLLAVTALRQRWRGREDFRRLYPWTPLLALFAIYGGSSIASQLNIGHRHILPLYPVLFIAAGALGTALSSELLWRRAVVAGLLGWHSFEGVRFAPFHLAYFNALAGGPANGRRHLVDSSLDWGQDLPALKHWLETHAQGQPTFLSYFGSGQPSYYGIKARRLAFLNNFKFEDHYAQLEPGVYCISATILQAVYSSELAHWPLESEKEYQTLRALEPLFAVYTQDPARRAELRKDAPTVRWPEAIKRHDRLRMARLTSYLRARQPDAHAGYSILIYRLNAAEVHAATAGSWSEWNQLIQKATLAD